MRIAVYPGSFDPLTNGHMDVLTQSLRLFDQVVVAVLQNLEKSPLFTVQERVHMIEQATSGMQGVVVESFSGLLVDYAGMRHANAVVRGLRDVGDFENELRMAHMNRDLNSQVVSVFIPTSHQYGFVSSSLIKDVAIHGGSIEAFVPEGVAKEISKRYPVNHN